MEEVVTYFPSFSSVGVEEEEVEEEKVEEVVGEEDHVTVLVLVLQGLVLQGVLRGVLQVKSFRIFKLI